MIYILAAIEVSRFVLRSLVEWVAFCGAVLIDCVRGNLEKKWGSGGKGGKG